MKPMTPPAEQKKMTEAQTNKAVANYRALLEKHAPEFDSEAVQLVLGQSELANDVFATFRKRVEAISNMITRRAKVNRGLKPQEVLNATGRKQYTNSEVVAIMPKGEGDEVEVVFFKLGRWVSDADLEKEYELRGLKPADPYSLAAVNQADPAFADEKPNGTHWQDENGKWYFAAFDRWRGGRDVRVNRRDCDWGDCWWFAGLRK
jgi:hypothetical protein